MINETINRFQYLLDTIPPLLSAIPEDEFSYKPAPDKWSKKEVIGHLADSAANNHQRFIRTQYEIVPFIVYDQNKWTDLNHYRDLQGKHVISFWTIYNTHILEIIKRIPQANLTRLCNSGDENNRTLEWLIDDYVVHMEHHLRQVIDY